MHLNLAATETNFMFFPQKTIMNREDRAIKGTHIKNTAIRYQISSTSGVTFRTT